MLRLLRPYVGHRPSFRVFNALILLMGLASSALATIDAQLNTTGFTPGQASEVSVDGLIYSGGSSTSINGALLTLRFDPADVTLSSVRPASGWTLQGANLDHSGDVQPSRVDRGGAASGRPHAAVRSQLRSGSGHPAADMAWR